MRLFLVGAACAALAACGSNTAPDAEATATATPMASATPMSGPTTGAATGSMTGRYEMKNADGTVTTEQINADGTYTDTANGREVERGTWRADGAKMCFDPAGSEAETCYTSTAPAADGSFRMMGPDGRETGVTIRKVGA